MGWCKLERKSDMIRFEPLEQKFLLLRWGLLVVVIVGQMVGSFSRPAVLFYIGSILVLLYNLAISVIVYGNNKHLKKFLLLTLYLDVPLYTLLLAGNTELFNILFYAYFLFVFFHAAKNSLRGLVVAAAESVLSLVITMPLSTDMTAAWDILFFRLLLLLAGFFIVQEINIMLNASQSQYMKAKAQAAEDPLTGLSNRLLLEVHYNKAIQFYKRTKQPFSIAIFDIDNFKNINDQKGHVYGDKVLQALARTLKANVRSYDFICRYGGEEFLIIFHACALTDACAKADKIRDQFAYSFFDRPVTVSVGVSLYQEGYSMAENIDIADKALYAAKEAGKNRTMSSSHYDLKLIHKEA